MELLRVQEEDRGEWMRSAIRGPESCLFEPFKALERIREYSAPRATRSGRFRRNRCTRRFLLFQLVELNSFSNRILLKKLRFQIIDRERFLQRLFDKNTEVSL